MFFWTGSDKRRMEYLFHFTSRGKLLVCCILGSPNNLGHELVLMKVVN